MDRQSVPIVAAAALLFTGLTSFSQENPAPNPPPTEDRQPPPQGGPDLRNKPDRPFALRPGFETMRRNFEQLPPDQKKRLLQNLERWKDLPKEERDVLREREKRLLARMTNEINEAVRKSGLDLDRDRRQVFDLRYKQERRKIEEKLRREMEDKRVVLLDEMIGRLKIEFSGTPTPSPSPTGKP